MVSDTALQAGAKAVHEALNGKGTWKTAPANERSASRHLVRAMLQAINAEEAAPKSQPAPEHSASVDAARFSDANTSGVNKGARVRSVLATK